MKRKIWLVSAEGERISISENATKKSIIISDYINGILGGGDVPLPELSREVLLKAVEFFEYHTEIDESYPLYAEHTTNLYEVNHFHLEFFNIRVKKLTKLIEAAKFLKAQELYSYSTNALIYELLFLSNPLITSPNPSPPYPQNPHLNLSSFNNLPSTPPPLIPSQIPY